MKMRRVNNNVLEICDENNEMILSIAEEINPQGKMIITLNGEVRNEVAHEFEDEIMAALSVCKNIELNMKNVSYIASMALKCLLSIQQMIDEMNGSSMVLTNVSQEVMTILKESGFSEILEIEMD